MCKHHSFAFSGLGQRLKCPNNCHDRLFVLSWPMNQIALFFGKRLWAASRRRIRCHALATVHTENIAAFMADGVYQLPDSKQSAILDRI